MKLNRKKDKAKSWVLGYSILQNEEQTAKKTKKKKPKTDQESAKSWMTRGKMFKGENTYLCQMLLITQERTEN